MKLYNSLSKKIEEFVPINKDLVGIYSCGPTVYNNLHIGNLSSFIYADLLRRSFNVNGFKTNHVMNITDVDDKTIRDSKSNYQDDSAEIALKKLTDKYTAVFMEDMNKSRVGIESMTFISAVQTIPEMIILVQKLLDKDIAYIADDGVYFSITKYYQTGHSYGVLQKVETQQSKSRIANDEYDKDTASDFALWKKAEKDEPSWNANFSEDNMVTEMPGRPGWHIECSAMSEKTLGIPFDIHTGGIDLKFPHHENEIAQTCGSGYEKLANYFFHNNHVLVDGKKMAKSANNFYTLRDVEEKGFRPEAFRLLVLESHYHSESNFSWEILSSASNRLKNWQNISDTIWQLPESEDLSIIKSINSALADNINTPLALKYVDNYFEKVVKEYNSPNKLALAHIDEALGIHLISEDIDVSIKELLKKRATARLNKDWDLADLIRKQLKAKDISVRDDINGQIWLRS